MDSPGLDCINGSVVGSNVHSNATIGIIIALGLIDVAVVLGNSLVIAAVLTTRKLRTVTNIFIVSLACADLLLGFAVLPFSISVEVLQMWIWGSVWCNMWLAIDVWLCTASILSLCAISLDRYIAVTRPIRYPSVVSPVRGKVLVMLVWVLSFVICLPPLLGWNEAADDEDADTHVLINASASHITGMPLPLSSTERIDFDSMYNYSLIDLFDEQLFSNISWFTEGSKPCSLALPTCELTPTKGYRIYAAMGSFFIPMLVMVFFYFRIYLAAIKTASSLRRGVLTTRSAREYSQHKADDLEMRVHRGGSRMSGKYAGGYSPERRTQHAVRLQNGGSYSPHILTKRESSVKQCLIKDRNKSHAIRSMCNAQTVVFLHPIGSHWKQKETRSKQKKDINSYQEQEVLNSSNHSVSNGATKPPCNTNGFETSPRIKKRQKTIHKESKFSNNVKGHARKFRRETKAAKTLAIIVGAFICCWCPFFTIYLIGAFCVDCVAPLMFSMFFWFGYCNSALNPCIYALFARDFRFAFHRLISCRRRKGFSHETRAAYVTGKRKTLTIPLPESESVSDY